MLTIPLQPVPSQIVAIVLENQNCQLSIYQKNQGIFVDLNSNGIDITNAVIALNGIVLTVNYSGFQGNLIFIDTQGNYDPTYDGLGSRYQLVYLTAEELSLIGEPA